MSKDCLETAWQKSGSSNLEFGKWSEKALIPPEEYSWTFRKISEYFCEKFWRLAGESSETTRRQPEDSTKAWQRGVEDYLDEVQRILGDLLVKAWRTPEKRPEARRIPRDLTKNAWKVQKRLSLDQLKISEGLASSWCMFQFLIAEPLWYLPDFSIN